MDLSHDQSAWVSVLILFEWFQSASVGYEILSALAQMNLPSDHSFLVTSC